MVPSGTRRTGAVLLAALFLLAPGSVAVPSNDATGFGNTAGAQSTSQVSSAQREANPQRSNRRSTSSRQDSSSRIAPPAQQAIGTIPVPFVFPRPEYYAGISLLYQGHFAEALDVFQGQTLGAIRSTSGGNWIDSIYYHTMIGVCRERLGNLPEALQSYDRAAQIYLAYPDWGLKVVYWVPLRQAQGRQTISAPWGESRRGSMPGVYAQQHFPIPLDSLPFELRSMLARGGGSGFSNDPTQLLQDVSQGRLLMLDTPELARCLAVLIQGRNRILGPMAPEDALSQNLLQSFQRGAFRRGHWSEAWGKLLLGLSYAGTGRAIHAKPVLEDATLMLGRFDHHLTGMALLQLAQLELAAGNWARAEELFVEAGYAAYFYGDPLTLAEALQGAAVSHGQTGGAPLPIVRAALDWARNARWRPEGILRDAVAVELIRYHAATLLADTRLRDLYTSLALTEAEQQLRARNTAAAVQALRDARAAVRRQRLVAPELEARFDYLSAMADYQKGNRDAGDQSLARAVQTQSQISPRRFQIQLAHQMASQDARLRVAAELYPKLLLDPGPEQWWQDPLDALSRSTWPMAESLEHWFHILRARSKTREAWEVAELARSARFLAALPLGGRLLWLRWILEAPDEAISAQAKLERTNLGVRFPDYAKRVAQWQDTRDRLGQLPLLPAVANQQKLQVQLVRTLTEIDQLRQLQLREIACSREPAGVAFPPRMQLDDLRKQLADGQIVWSFFISAQRVYSFMASADQFDAWEVGSTQETAALVRQLLRALGNVRAGRPLPPDALQNDQWKTVSQKLLTFLLQGRSAQELLRADEIIVVPDGSLWFLPFELLGADPAGDPDSINTLLAHVRWRYAPTASLAVLGRNAKPVTSTAMVLMDRARRKQAAPWDDQLAADLQAIPHLGETIALRMPAATPRPANIVGKLVVLAESSWEKTGPLGWQLFSTNGRGAAPTLSEFVQRPWQGLGDVVLAGLRTGADTALADVDADAAGREIFLATTGWMAAGSRTVLISRWKVGGQSTRRLLREFLRESADSSASAAWQRAVLLSARHRLHPDEEPRLSGRGDVLTASASHPFFWSGYLLVDAGP